MSLVDDRWVGGWLVVGWWTGECLFVWWAMGGLTIWWGSPFTLSGQIITLATLSASGAWIQHHAPRNSSIDTHRHHRLLYHRRRRRNETILYC